MSTAHSWHGVIAKVNAASTDGRVLAFPPDLPLPHRNLPLLLGVSTSDEDRWCGSITRLWDIGNSIYGSGDVEPDPETWWGRTLLAGDPVPCGVAAHHVDMSVDLDTTGDWWHLGHEPQVPHPPVQIITRWSIASVRIQDNAVWPGVFLRLTTP
jgi:hypothetical protein